MDFMTIAELLCDIVITSNVSIVISFAIVFIITILAIKD